MEQAVIAMPYLFRNRGGDNNGGHFRFAKLWQVLLLRNMALKERKVQKSLA